MKRTFPCQNEPSPLLKAVIFDMDATLLDWSGFSADWQAVARVKLQPVHAFLAGEGHPVPAFEPFVEDINARSQAAWLNTENGNLDAPGLRDVVAESLAGFGLDMGRIDLDALLDLYPWGQVPGTRLYPEVRPVLETLRGAGVRLGLLTNAFQPMWMRDKELRDLGIEHYFDCRTSAADVGKLKPHALPFRHTLHCLEAETGSAVCVGDSLYTDIAGAQAIGMRAVWLRPDDYEMRNDAPTPDATIASLDQLLPLLDGWYAGWRDGR